MTEAELTAALLELLHLLGWRAVHHRPARTRHGWSTPLQGPTSTGFPDVLALRGARCIAAELKVGRNKPTAEQLAWLATFDAAGIETFVWTDKDWTAGEIERALRQQQVVGVSRHEKAAQLLADHAVQVVWATDGLVQGKVRGPHGIYDVCWTRVGGWSCSCAAYGECSHRLAIASVTMRSVLRTREPA